MDTTKTEEVPAADARVVARLLCGGQGLRGRDPRCRVRASPLNCCFLCLAQGRREAETLRHFVYACPAFAALRAAHELKPLLRAAPDRFLCFHRDGWTWRELRVIRNFLTAAWNERLRGIRQLQLSLATGEDLHDWMGRRFAERG